METVDSDPYNYEPEGQVHPNEVSATAAHSHVHPLDQATGRLAQRKRRLRRTSLYAPKRPRRALHQPSADSLACHAMPSQDTPDRYLPIHGARGLKIISSQVGRSQTLLHLSPLWGDLASKSAGIPLYALLLADNFLQMLSAGLGSRLATMQ